MTTNFDSVDYFTDPSLVPDPHPYYDHMCSQCRSRMSGTTASWPSPAGKKPRQCEFLAEYAKPFSTLVIADLLGVP